MWSKVKTSFQLGFTLLDFLCFLLDYGLCGVTKPRLIFAYFFAMVLLDFMQGGRTEPHSDLA
jgi:hypothetical protein